MKPNHYELNDPLLLVGPVTEIPFRDRFLYLDLTIRGEGEVIRFRQSEVLQLNLIQGEGRE